MKFYPLCRAERLPQAIVLADGEFPRHALPLAFLQACPRIVCCDGAAAGLLQYGREPVAIVGDGDSLSVEIGKKYTAIIRQEQEQETNDLSKAFRFCLKQGWKDILILGATGKREDHTLGNVSLLMEYRKEARVEMLTDYGLFTPVCGDAGFESFPGQQVSVFNMGCSRLKGEGLKYPLSVFPGWWQGTLNEATEQNFSVYTDGYLLIYRTLSVRNSGPGWIV